MRSTRPFVCGHLTEVNDLRISSCLQTWFIASEMKFELLSVISLAGTLIFNTMSNNKISMTWSESKLGTAAVTIHLLRYSINTIRYWFPSLLVVTVATSEAQISPRYDGKIGLRGAVVESVRIFLSWHRLQYFTLQRRLKLSCVVAVLQHTASCAWADWKT